LGTGLGWPYYSYPDESYYGYGPYGQYWYCDNPPGYYPYVQQYSHASRHQCCRQCAHRRRHHHDIIDQNVDAAIGSDGGLDQPAEISARVYRGVPLFGRTELLIRDPQLSFDGRCYRQCIANRVGAEPPIIGNRGNEGFILTSPARLARR
jgi:hypothetical protein